MPDDEKKHLPEWAKALAKFVGLALGAAMVSVLASLGITKDAKAEAIDESTQAAETAAAETAATVEQEVARVLGELTPELAEEFEGIDADLGDIEARLESCEKQAHEATVTANVALRLLESRYGSGTIGRTFERVEREEPKPPPPSPKSKSRKTSLKLPEYQQQIQVEPMMAEEP